MKRSRSARKTYRRYRLNCRWHVFLKPWKKRLERARRLLGAEYWCVGTGGCGRRCKHPPASAMGPYCPHCLNRVYRTTTVNWADDLPWAHPKEPA